MNKKLDIMRQRKNEQWEIVNGKVQRVEKQKVVGPIVENGIKEIEVVELKEKKKWKNKKLKKK